jgi:hypothetical protein
LGVILGASFRLVAWARGIGEARGLVDFQLADIAVDGELGAGFIAREGGEGVGIHAIAGEGTGEAVVRVGRSGGGRVEIGVLFVVFLVVDRFPIAGVVPDGDVFKARAVDALFHSEVAVEAPLICGDARDQHFFGFADGAESIVEAFEEQQEIFGVVAVEQDVFIGAHAVGEAVAAGCGLAGGAGGAGGFLGVLAVGVDACLGEGGGFVRIFHMCDSGQVSPILSLTC